MMSLEDGFDYETVVCTSVIPSDAATNRPQDVSSVCDESSGCRQSQSVQIPSLGYVNPSPLNPPEQQQQSSSLPVFGGHNLVLSRPLRPITLKFEDVEYTIKVDDTKNGGLCFSPQSSLTEKTILEGVTGMVNPGETLAMLGPSGSGKTTLLTALAGRLHQRKLSGNITYNGQPFSSSVKRMTGFVSQDDVLYPHLTVYETLVFSALLRLPNTLTGDERIHQAERVIEELGLTKCRNSIVGGSLVRGISGGERKRVCIGQEMLINPSLLLLDEPTSGMDSTTAQRIVSTLQCLARGGRTVITTIHQPSSRLYHMFDRVLLLSEGNCVYSGKASDAIDYFSSLGFTPSLAMNPADFMLDLANGVTLDSKVALGGLSVTYQPDHNVCSAIKQSLILSYKKNMAFANKAELASNDYQQEPFAMEIKNQKHRHHLSSSSLGFQKQWSTSWWEQFTVLLTRSLKERKHESFSSLKIFQVLSVSVLSGLMWWQSNISNIQDQVGLLFFFSIFWGFYPLSNAVFTFPQERSMLVKEQNSRMYRLSSYFVARMVGDLPMELILPTVFITISYWMGGLKPSFPAFVLTLCVILYSVFVSQGLGLALGAVLMDVKQGATLASVLMLTFLLAGGYYVQHVPLFMSWMKYFSFSYYCYKLLLGVQYSDDDYFECGSTLCRVADYPAIKHVGLDHKGFDVAALTVMLVGYRLIAYAALRMGRAARY